MIVRPCVLVPAYNNPATLNAVVEGCLRSTTLPIIVVDDGSSPPVAKLPSDSRVQVIRHELNRGKGAAIKTGFRRAIGLGYTHAVTIDADGQHLPSDIPAILEAANRSPWNLVIGCRQMNGTEVPGISKFGKGFSNFWIRFETSVPVSDSQSGFRVYPLFHVQTLSCRGDRYDFEVEILTKLLWRGVEVTEVPVRVIYEPIEKRVSHFRKFRDNARITWANTRLIIGSLLRKHLTPGQTAVAAGLGVFIGCSPFYGLHSVIAAAAAFFLRLNFGVLFLGTQVSLPFLAPFLAMASVSVGNSLRGIRPSGTAAFLRRGFSALWLSASCWVD